MLCPWCTKEYSVEDIENHVDSCSASINVIPKESLSTPKRVFPREEISETNPLKKHKANPMINMTHMNQQKTMLNKDHIPLAERMRPKYLTDYVGQETVIGPDTALRELLTKGHIPSMIFWGPPGCGKVT